jgi:hypothetical protein
MNYLTNFVICSLTDGTRTFMSVCNALLDMQYTAGRLLSLGGLCFNLSVPD